MSKPVPAFIMGGKLRWVRPPNGYIYTGLHGHTDVRPCAMWGTPRLTSSSPPHRLVSSIRLVLQTLDERATDKSQLLRKYPFGC